MFRSMVTTMENYGRTRAADPIDLSTDQRRLMEQLYVTFTIAHRAHNRVTTKNALFAAVDPFILAYDTQETLSIAGRERVGQN